MLLSRSRRTITRALAAGAWLVVLLLVVSPSRAHALGLPFVDLFPDGGEIVDSAVSGVQVWLMTGMVSGMTSLLNLTIEAIDTATVPNLKAAWFSGRYETTVELSIYLMLIVALVSIIAATLQGKPLQTIRTLGASIPLAVFATACAVALVTMSLRLADDMTAAVFAGTMDDVEVFMLGVGNAMIAMSKMDPTGAGAIAPFILMMLLGLMVSLALIMVLIILYVRTALIYLAVAFLPIVFATSVWPPLKQMATKTIELLAVLIFTKFAIVFCFALGASAAGGAVEQFVPAKGKKPVAIESNEQVGDALQALIIGTAIMGVAAFSPMFLLRIMSSVSGSMQLAQASQGIESATPVPSSTEVMRNTMRSAAGRVSTPQQSAQRGGSVAEMRGRVATSVPAGAGARGGAAGAGGAGAASGAGAAAGGAGAGAGAAAAAAGPAAGVMVAGAVARHAASQVKQAGDVGGSSSSSGRRSDGSSSGAGSTATMPAAARGADSPSTARPAGAATGAAAGAAHTPAASPIQQRGDKPSSGSARDTSAPHVVREDRPAPVDPASSFQKVQIRSARNHGGPKP